MTRPEYFDASVPNEQHVGPRSVLADYYGPFGWFEGSIEPAVVQSAIERYGVDPDADAPWRR